MNDDMLETTDTREKAGTLLNNLLTFSFVCLLQFWKQVLHAINVVQKRLQSPRMNIREATADLDSLIEHFTNKRSQLYQSSVNKGLRVAEEWNISTERRVRRKKKMDGEEATDDGLTLVAHTDRVMKLAVDGLVQEIHKRSERLRDLNSKFGFLLVVPALISSH